MPRRTVYIDDATAMIVRHAFGDEAFSSVVQRGITALCAALPITKQRAVFRSVAAELGDRFDMDAALQASASKRVDP